MTGMRALIVTDLDRTMIYSRDAWGGWTDAAEAVCVEQLDGAALSYMTSTAVGLLRDLTDTTVFVPTTTRTIEQFRRIRLPGTRRHYAITSNGGNILVDGVPDARWREFIETAVRAEGASLAQVCEALHARVDDSWVSKFRIADELFCYLVVDPAAVPDGFLAEWDQWCREHGWSASQQGRKIYTMPEAVCKSRAVAEITERLIDEGLLDPGVTTFAAGDGALDAEMLNAADFAVRPRHGELEQLGWACPGLTVTAAEGILAGEEMLDWFARRATVGVPLPGVQRAVFPEESADSRGAVDPGSCRSVPGREI